MINSLPILTFHSLDDSGSPISVAPDRFGRLMTALKAHGFHTVSLPDAVHWIRDRAALPERAIVITFDDGYESTYTIAYPTLRDLGFSAAVFLVTDHCGRMNNWPMPVARIPDLPMLTWDQVGEMGDSVFAFHAHTRTHPDLRGASTQRITDEALGSREAIEARTGRTADFFAYPFGHFDSRARLVVSRYFSGACGVTLDYATPASDVYALERIEMYYFSGRYTSAMFTSAVRDRYLSIRRFLRQLKTSP